MDLVLGTAQFGQQYGVTNRSENYNNYNELEEILTLLSQKGFYKLDTAQSYGDSEKMLGSIGVKNFHITSKIKLPKNLLENKNKIIDSVGNSLKNLGIDKLDCLLAHNSDFLKANKEEAINLINSLKNNNLIDKFGVSIYEPSDMLDSNLLDVIQFPCNIFDHRFLKVNQYTNNKIIWQCRSIFLQGILLESFKKLPIYFKRYFDVFKSYHEDFPLLEDRMTACISFIMQQEFQEFIVGVSCVNELKDIFYSIEKHQDDPLNKDKFNGFSCEIEELIDPRLWRDN